MFLFIIHLLVDNNKVVGHLMLCYAQMYDLMTQQVFISHFEMQVEKLFTWRVDNLEDIEDDK